MAITYPNTWRNFQYIYTYDGGVYSGNLYNTAAFDYFPDDAAVNDAIYFGSTAYHWRNIQVNVGTAFAATSVTFIWEWYGKNDAGTDAWHELSVTDNTNDFNTLGQNSIEFVPPAGWLPAGVNGQTNLWIRCRISAIDTPTEGGANTTDKAQLGENIIYATGYSEVTPATPKDVYNADVAGSWGVVDFTRNMYHIYGSYHFAAHPQVGDASNAGYFKSLYNRLDFNRAYLTFRMAHNDTIVQFGEKVAHNGYLEYGRDGGSAYMPGTTFGGFVRVSGTPTLRLYGASVFTDGSQYTAFNANIHADIYDSILMRGTTHLTNTSKFNNCSLVNLSLFNSPEEFNNVRIPYRFQIGGGGTFENLNTYEIYYCNNYPNTSVAYVRNSTYEVATYGIIMLDRGITAYYQYSFDLTVIDEAFDPISGVTVVMKDQYDNEVFSDTTDVNGQITSQWVTYEKYIKIVTPAQESQTFYTPHLVTLSKTGLETRVIQYTMDQQRDEVEMMGVPGGGLLTHPGMAGGMRG